MLTVSSQCHSGSTLILIVFVTHGVSLVPVVRIEISAGISVASALRHLWLVAVSLVSPSVTR